MNDAERYLIDLQGYLHIPGLLTPDQAQQLLAAAIALEQHALACRENSPRFKSVWGPEYWQNQEHKYFSYSSAPNPGHTLMVEDFWLFPDAFDCLIGHPRTMDYIRRFVHGPVSINNSELRIRYPGNATSMHMGHPGGRNAKYRYEVIDGEIHATMVRMIYFLHDVDMNMGPTCFVPGSHRGAFPMPLENVTPEQEPGVVAFPVKAGDGILFTENCRHGGFTNHANHTRYTLHVGYGPHFLKSQNIATMDQPVHTTDALLNRLTQPQRDLLVPKTRIPL